MAVSFAETIKPWLKRNVPLVRRQFDLNRDPFVREELLAGERAARRKEERQGRGSFMVRADRPGMAFNPPPSQRSPQDRRSFNGNWLREQRNAAIAQASVTQARDSRDVERDIPCREPSL